MFLAFSCPGPLTHWLSEWHTFWFQRYNDYNEYNNYNDYNDYNDYNYYNYYNYYIYYNDDRDTESILKN